MFYSETLLSKTGPLARVWLSANLERKLSKTHILQSNIESSVNAIVDQGQAPMALRLSGQLLLGVVRIYSRKARYLMDDCNEALLKIKMAFRPGNLDMTILNSEIANPGLTLPDTIAEPEVLPMLDESLLNLNHMDLDLGAKDNDAMNWTSQVFSDPPSAGHPSRVPREQPVLYDDDLGLDIDLSEDPSIEAGRNAPLAAPLEEELMSHAGKLHDDDLNLNYDEDEPFEPALAAEDPANDLVSGAAMDIENVDNFQFNVDDSPPPATTAPTGGRVQRDHESPLSSLRSSVERDPDDTTLTEEPRQARQRAIKRRKALPIDAETVIGNSQIKQQQVDRSAILKPASLLPKDPVLLALMSMQQSGAFVSNIMGDGRSRGWAPELRGILSIELVRQSGALKRKRDSGVADLEQDDDPAHADIPQLHIPDDTIPMQDEGIAMDDDSGAEKSAMIHLPADDGAGFPAHEDQREGSEDVASPMQENFDDTTAPLVHPADSGPVSLGTQHAVHLLRDRFGGSESQSSQSKAHVLFQDLLPEATTSKIDATKMFFEILVLATKDAVKVEQAEGNLGGPIRVRGKRGLWGAWAEREAGGEIAQQDEPPPSSVVVT